jgi:Cu/Zn superoxide dismutase
MIFLANPFVLILYLEYINCQLIDFPIFRNPTAGEKCWPWWKPCQEPYICSNSRKCEMPQLVNGGSQCYYGTKCVDPYVCTNFFGMRSYFGKCNIIESTSKCGREDNGALSFCQMGYKCNNGTCQISNNRQNCRWPWCHKNYHCPQGNCEDLSSKIGQNCYSGRTCEPPLSCYGGICMNFNAQVGERCDLMTTFCKNFLTCENNVCKNGMVPLAGFCDVNTTFCEPPLLCVSNKCQSVSLASVGVCNSNLTSLFTASVSFNSLKVCFSFNYRSAAIQASGLTPSTFYLYHIHEFPIGADGKCTNAGGHYNPTKANYTVFPPIPGFYRTYEVGDLSGKYGFITGNTSFIPQMFPDHTLTYWNDQAFRNRSMVVHNCTLTVKETPKIFNSTNFMCSKLSCANILPR